TRENTQPRLLAGQEAPFFEVAHVNSVGNKQDMHTQPTNSEVSNTEVRTAATDEPSSKGSVALLDQLETTNDPQLWVTVEKEAVQIKLATDPFEEGSSVAAVLTLVFETEVIMRMRPISRNEEGGTIVEKTSGDTLSIQGQKFTFDTVVDETSTRTS
nr:kinesin-like protein KIN-12B [Tanacetum cinerariifolium]